MEQLLTALKMQLFLIA